MTPSLNSIFYENHNYERKKFMAKLSRQFHRFCIQKKGEGIEKKKGILSRFMVQKLFKVV